MGCLLEKVGAREPLADCGSAVYFSCKVKTRNVPRQFDAALSTSRFLASQTYFTILEHLLLRDVFTGCERGPVNQCRTSQERILDAGPMIVSSSMFCLTYGNGIGLILRLHVFARQTCACGFEKIVWQKKFGSNPNTWIQNRSRRDWLLRLKSVKISLNAPAWAVNLLALLRSHKFWNGLLLITGSALNKPHIICVCGLEGVVLVRHPVPGVRCSLNIPRFFVYCLSSKAKARWLEFP